MGLFHVQGPVRVKAIMRIKTKRGNQGYFRCAEQRKLVDKNFSLCTYVSHDAASEIPGFHLGSKCIGVCYVLHVSELSEPIWKIADERL